MKNPWWIPPFLGRIPDVEPHHLRVLGLVCVGMIFEQYDLSLINAALKQIAGDIGMAIEDSGWYLGVIRLGGVATILLVPLADRIGRRRVFLGALVVMSVGTATTAFAQTPVQFMLIQSATRACLLTCAAVAVVMVVEEFPAAHRGWGVGMLGVLSALGYGLGTLGFALIDLLPYGWRALYLFGCVPLFLLPFYRRELRETARYRAHSDARGDAASIGGPRAWFQPVVLMARTHPRRLAGIALAAMFLSAGSIGLFQYASYFVQTEHGWVAWQYSLLIVGGGFLGIGGGVVGGRASDRSGRRRVGFTALVLAPIGCVLFFLLPGWALALCFGAFVFCLGAGDVVIRSLSGELFPTSHRGTSVGAYYVVSSVGFSTGLFLIAVGVEATGNFAMTIGLMSLFIALAGVAVLLLPETHQRELESISEERAS